LKDDTKGVREVRHTLRPLREVWMKVGVEKLDMHKGVTVKALLDNSVMLESKIPLNGGTRGYIALCQLRERHSRAYR